MNKKGEFVKEFERIMEDNGEILFLTGDEDLDYNHIVGHIKFNGGYWAGVDCRYHFDENLKITHVTPRRFGV